MKVLLANVTQRDPELQRRLDVGERVLEAPSQNGFSVPSPV
jgi:hypothetical protein